MRETPCSCCECSRFGEGVSNLTFESRLAVFNTPRQGGSWNKFILRAPISHLLLTAAHTGSIITAFGHAGPDANCKTDSKAAQEISGVLAREQWGITTELGQV